MPLILDRHAPSACFNTETICSTENFFFMANSLPRTSVGFAEILTFYLVQFWPRPSRPRSEKPMLWKDGFSGSCQRTVDQFSLFLAYTVWVFNLPILRRCDYTIRCKGCGENVQARVQPMPDTWIMAECCNGGEFHRGLTPKMGHRCSRNCGGQGLQGQHGTAAFNNQAANHSTENS